MDNPIQEWVKWVLSGQCGGELVWTQSISNYNFAKNHLVMTTVESIKVVIRFRPANTLENTWTRKNKIDLSNYVVHIHEPDCKCVELYTKDGLVPNKKFYFDYVFDYDTAQDKFFNIAAKGVVENLFKGFNATIFAYGQTGSGKTYSMMGPSYGQRNLKPELRGVIPRSVDYIFEQIQNSPPTLDFKISVSYLEIYKERIKDLLFPKNDNLPIHGTPESGIYVKGLSKVFVSNRDEIFNIITKGDYNRSMAKTDMNAHSSRSHSVLVLKIVTAEGESEKDKSTTTAKLNLVDLAGSEKVGKTNVTGTQLEEAKKINQSLSALGHCINSIVKKRKHIPFRDSKLTRILEESIGGRAKCSIICCCSKHLFNREETFGTLGFGKRAKSIQVRVKQNKVLSVAQLMKIVEKLKKQLLAQKKKNKVLLLRLKELRGKLLPEEEKELASLSAIKADESLIGKSDEEIVASKKKKKKKSEGGEEVEGENEGENEGSINEELEDMESSIGGGDDLDADIVNLPLEALKNELQKLRAEKMNDEQHFKETLDNEEQKQKVLSLKVEEMEKILEATKEENEVLLDDKEKIDAYKKDMEKKLTYEKEMGESRISQYQEENDGLLKRVSELEEANQDMEGKIQVMEGTAIKDPKKRGEYQTQLEKYAREFKELKGENEYLMEMVDKKNVKVDELHALVLEKDHKVKENSLRYEKLNKFKDSLITQLESFEKDLEDADKNVMTLAQENENFEKQAQQVAKENQSLYEKIQQKNILMKKMRILLQKNNIDVLQVRDIKLDQLIDDEKKRLEKSELAAGLDDKELEKAVASNVLNIDGQISNLEEFETQELKVLENLVYGPPPPSFNPHLPGYVQMQDGTFQSTTDGRIIQGDEISLGEDGFFRAPDGGVVVGKENEHGAIVGVVGVKELLIPQGYIKLQDETYIHNIKGEVIPTEFVTFNEEGYGFGPDGLPIVGQECPNGGILYLKEGGKGNGGIEVFDDDKPALIQMKDGTYQNVVDGSVVTAEQLQIDENGLCTGPNGESIIGMEAPAGGFVKLGDSSPIPLEYCMVCDFDSDGATNGGGVPNGVVEEDHPHGYVQLQDGTFQNNLDGTVITADQLVEGEGGVLCDNQGLPVVGAQQIDGTIIYEEVAKVAPLPQGYVQLQDGNFQDTATGDMIVPESMGQTNNGIITGPSGLGVVAMQSITGEVFELDTAGGIELFKNAGDGYVQLQDGNFKNVKDGSTVSVDKMGQAENGEFVGPTGGAVLGMESMNGTYISFSVAREHAAEKQQKAEIVQGDFGYIQLQDGNFQRSVDGAMVAPEEMTKDESGVIVGPDGLKLVALQTCTGEVVGIEGSLGMKEIRGTFTQGYVQMQSGAFISIDDGSEVAPDLMQESEGGEIVGPNGGSIVGMETPYQTIANVQSQQGSIVGGGFLFANSSGGGGTSQRQVDSFGSGKGFEFPSVPGKDGNEEEEDAKTPEITLKLPSIKIDGLGGRIKEGKKRKKRPSAFNKLPSPSELRKAMKIEGSPQVPSAPVLGIKADEFQEQLLSEVEKNRDLSTKLRALKTECRQLKFEIEEKDSNLIEKEVQLRTESVRQGFELSQIRVKELEERLSEKETLFDSLKKKKDETITILEDEKTKLIAEREKYIQSASSGGKQGGRNFGGFKNIADGYFALQLKSRKMDDDLKFFRKNYNIQRKQNTTDRRKMKDQEGQISRSNKRIKEIEQQLAIARNRYIQRKEVVTEFNKEKKRLESKIEQLKQKIEFLKDMQDTKREIESSGSVSSGSLDAMSNITGGKVVKVIRGGGSNSIRGGSSKSIRGGGGSNSIRGGSGGGGGGGGGGNTVTSKSIRGGLAASLRGINMKRPTAPKRPPKRN